MENSARFSGFDASDVESFLAEKTPVTKLLLPWCIALFTAAGIAWTWISEIDIVSSTRGVIIPNSRLQYIQSSGSNVVDRILVKEGETVNEGDVLVTFLQIDKLSEKAKIDDAIRKNRARAYRLAAMADFLGNRRAFIPPPENNPFLHREMSIFDYQKAVFLSEQRSLGKKIEGLATERRSLALEIELLDALIPKTIEEIERSSRLLEEGIIGQDQLDPLNEKRIRQKKEKQIKRSRIQGIEAEIAFQKASNQLANENQLHDIAVERLKLDQEFRILRQDLSRLDSEVSLKNRVSPISGVVNEVMVYTRGAVVQSGESILSIVPEHSPLEVEAKILNQDVGFVEEGQTVAVKLDSFNFTRYGKLNGTIRRIASGAIEDPQLGMVYPTIIELTHQQIEVDGKTFQLKPGMTVTIDIKTGQRKIADYIIEPFLRYSDEALRER